MTYLSKSFYLEDFEESLTKIKSELGPFLADLDKQTLIFPETDIQVKIPFHLKLNDNASIQEIAYLIIIIHSGEAVLAYCESDLIIEHKTVKAYMVRKKQGKSQLKYLKTKGKSKAGSRVRLASTDDFFNKINEKLHEWLTYFAIDKIALSCNKTLSPYFFNRENAALKKDDNRLIKIPKHIQEASFDNLLSTHQFLIETIVTYPEEEKHVIERIKNKIIDE